MGSFGKFWGNGAESVTAFIGSVLSDAMKPRAKSCVSSVVQKTPNRTRKDILCSVLSHASVTEATDACSQDLRAIGLYQKTASVVVLT